MDARALNLNKPLPPLPPPMGPSENASSGAPLPPAPPRGRMGGKMGAIYTIFKFMVRTSFLFHLHNNPLLCRIALWIGRSASRGTWRWEIPRTTDRDIYIVGY